MQEQIGNESIYNSKKELKENAKNKEHWNVMNMSTAFNGLLSRLKMAKEVASELKDVINRNSPN